MKLYDLFDMCAYRTDYKQIGDSVNYAIDENNATKFTINAKPDGVLLVYYTRSWSTSAGPVDNDVDDTDLDNDVDDIVIYSWRNCRCLLYRFCNR